MITLSSSHASCPLFLWCKKATDSFANAQPMEMHTATILNYQRRVPHKDTILKCLRISEPYLCQ